MIYNELSKSNKIQKVKVNTMDDLMLVMKSNSLNVLPNYILNDIDYIYDCYLNNVTVMNFSEVHLDMCCDQQCVSIDEIIYSLMFNTLKKKSIFNNCETNDLVIYTYLDYYVENHDAGNTAM